MLSAKMPSMMVSGLVDAAGACVSVCVYKVLATMTRKIMAIIRMACIVSVSGSVSFTPF